MEEKQKKVELWSYPFKVKGIGTAASTEVTDPQIYYEALATAESGYYPVARNGLWHGGVHFDQNTAAILDQSSVRCIADGLVIAYRIDETYKTLTYTGCSACRDVTYSTGFVLVKHRLELPPAPAATTPPAGTPPAAEPDLTFYSLYMHLMDWENYEKAGAPTPPTFMCPTHYAVSEEGATNDFSGLFVRGGAPGTPEHASKVAIIPKGCKVRVGDKSPIDVRWRKLVSILEGKAFPALVPGIDHWVFVDEMSPTADGDVLLTGEKANDVKASLLPGKGLTVRKEANRHSAAMAVLPVDAQVLLEDGTGSFRKIKSIVASTLTSPLSPECAPNIAGYIHFDSLKAIPQPPTLKTVQILEPPVPIQAGALIGHLGKYQAASQSEAHDLLHLEVFSCDDVEAFVNQSSARAQQLKPEQKTLLKIPSSTKVITKEGASQTNPPAPSDPGQPTTYDMILPLAVLNALPADRKITLTTTASGTTTTEQWWKLDNLPGEGGNPISGWVKEGELMTPRYHPWDWEGFDFLEDTDTPSSGLAYYLNATRRLSDDEKVSYQGAIDQSDKGPVRSRLYDIIDTNRNGKMTSEEIRAALEKPWHAQSISKLVTRHESEWFWDASRWDELDDLMGHSPDDPNQDWVEEKNRIKTLSWWSDVAGSLKLDAAGKAWHLQPIHLVIMQNISVAPASELISAENMKKIFPSSQEAVREEVRTLFNKYADLFEVNTPERISQFFAQVKAEVGDALVGKEEDLWYSTAALRSLFGRYFNHYPQEADELGYKRIPKQQYNALPASAKSGYRVIKEHAYSQLPQEDEIAKRIYCCSVPGQNFHLTPGGCAEGLAYKGKGFIQLTWKENYKEVERLLKAKIPNENIDIVANPNQVLETKYGLLTALGFWEWQSLNEKSGNSTTHTDEITKVVNLHTKSYAKRKENFEFIYGILKNAQ